MGRPSNFSAERAQSFVEAIKLGATVPAASARAGWKVRSAYRYLARGKEALARLDVPDDEDPGSRLEELGADEAIARFAMEYEFALEASEAQILAHLLADAQGEKGKKGDWRAKAWLLERRWPERWSNRRRVGADRQKAEAEARLAEAQAEIAEHQLKQLQRGGRQGGRLLLPDDLLGAMTVTEPELAERFANFLARFGVQVVRRSTLSAGITDADVSEVSPSPTKH